MKLAALLLAAPAVLQLVAADPRPTPAPNGYQIRRVLDRWNFQRQLSTGGAAASSQAGNTDTEKATTATTPASTPATTSTSAAPTTTSTSAAAETTATSATSQAQTSQSQTQTSQTQPTSRQAADTTSAPQSEAATTAPVPLTTPSPTSSQLVTTDGQGSPITTIIVITQSAVPATSTAASDDSGGSISKGTIIGLAVTGSIAVLIVILLIVWKLTNKRFSDLEDTGDDAIKWPELHKDSAAMTPLPTRPTGRTGVETNALDDFDAQSSAAHSTADLTGVHYQPYSDDPGYGARPAYYDPYGGVPGSARPYASPPGSHDGDHKGWGAPAEGQGYADPHAQYYAEPPMRGASPGPNMAYGDSLGRGMSPGPNMAYGDGLGRGTSPGPNMAYADPMGRTASPAPTAYSAYPPGYGPEAVGGDPYAGGRHSPGPNLAYSGSQHDQGRRSPGPGLAYGARAGSPGPNVAYDQGGYR